MLYIYVCVYIYIIRRLYAILYLLYMICCMLYRICYLVFVLYFHYREDIMHSILDMITICFVIYIYIYEYVYH